jgi:rfaE bifunctional protein nucleotidyltransferase chain/domain
MLKGEGRPLNDAQSRASLIDALEIVDGVVIFEHETVGSLLTQLRPDVFVKGSDYSLDDLPEASIAAHIGARVVLIPISKGVSTTTLIARAALVGWANKDALQSAGMAVKHPFARKSRTPE